MSLIDYSELNETNNGLQDKDCRQIKIFEESTCDYVLLEMMESLTL